MNKVSFGEIMPKKKSIEYKYIIGAAVLAVILIVAVVTAFVRIPDEEIAETVVKEEWDTPVRINEVMTDNSLFAPAANGKCYDWIELHNSSEEAVDLSGHYISDNPDKLDKFLIESLVMEPGEYVVIYMSRLSGVDENGMLHTNFALSSLGESIYVSNSEGTIISTLTVPEGGSNISYGIYNNKLVWLSTPTPGAENGGSYAENEAKLEYDIAEIRINEYMTDNRSVIYDCEGDYNDWVELYNPTEEAVDLSGYTMTDNIENIDKWEFPEGTVIKAGGYLLIYCSDKDKSDDSGYLHTNFRLGSEDKAIMIYTPQAQLCAMEELIFVPENNSYGYVDVSDEKAYYSLPTPGTANTTPAVTYTEEHLKKMQGIYEEE